MRLLRGSDHDSVAVILPPEDVLKVLELLRHRERLIVMCSNLITK